MNQVRPSSTSQGIVDLLHHLGLDRASPNHFYGRYREFPVSLTILWNQEVVGLLFQLCHAQDHAAMSRIELDLDSTLSELIRSRAADVQVEGHRAWLNLFDAAELLQKNQVIGLLDGFIEELQRWNVHQDLAKCHQCHKAEGALVVQAGQVNFLCAECAAKVPPTNETFERLHRRGKSNLAMLAMAIVLMGAGFWAARNWLLPWLR